jgi:hypothetical protein
MHLINAHNMERTKLTKYKPAMLRVIMQIISVFSLLPHFLQNASVLT